MTEEEKKKADLDGDGDVSDKERKKYDKQQEKEKEDNRDRLEADLMQSEYGWAADLIYSNDNLKRLFKQAVDEGWTAARFLAKFKDTGFYQNHTEAWLKTEALKQTKPKAYEDRIKDTAAKLIVDAAQIGAQMSEEQARKLADTYLRRGFGSPEKAAVYQGWLATRVRRQSSKSPDGTTTDLGFEGNAGEVEQALLSTLRRNGFDGNSQVWQDWITKQVTDIVAGRGKLSSAQDYLRRTAGSRYPSYADKMVSEGKDLQDYAQGYITSMNEILEIPEDQLDVTDPTIRSAMLGQADDKGETKPMSLWDFEKSLKQDARWRYTKNANNTMANAATSILKSFGFVG